MPPAVPNSLIFILQQDPSTGNPSAPEPQFPPSDEAALLANLVCRVFLAIVGTLLCWVPFRLLYRNGEFAAVVLIVDVALMNLFTVLDSLIWSSDNWEGWWDGRGLCDIQVYLSGPLQTVYAAAIFAVIHHLAGQVRMMRAVQLDRQEKTRRNLIQASIIFGVPAVQLMFTWFDLAQRYVIGTLVGCSAVYDSSWPKNLVYDAPPAAFAMAAVPYAYLTWKRFKAISKTTAAALKFNSAASSRANRTRRRLYNMSLSILTPYLPLMLYFLVVNIQDTLSSYKTYSYARIHGTTTTATMPYPWNSILFIPSWIVPGATMNQPWIPIATTVPIVVFFGMTRDAVEMYRRYAVAVGLARWFPRLERGGGAGRTKRRAAVGDSDETRSSGISDAGGPSGHPNKGPRLARQIPILPITEPSRQRAVPTSLSSSPSSSSAFSQAAGIRTIPSQSPLESSSVIAPVIPPRTSSLRRGFPYMPNLNLKHFPTPTIPSMPSIRLPSFPSLHRRQNRSASGDSRNDTASRRSRSRDLSSSSAAAAAQDSIPMLPVPEFGLSAGGGIAVAAERGGRSETEMEARSEATEIDSPRTVGSGSRSVYNKSSRDAVLPREMMGAGLDRPGELRVQIPFYPSMTTGRAKSSRGSGSRKAGEREQHGFERVGVVGGGRPTTATTGSSMNNNASSDKGTEGKGFAM